MRLDQYLTSKGFFESRNKAADAVKRSCFTVNKKPVLKPSFDVSEADLVEKVVEETTYVARSAHKLLKAYQAFNLNWQGLIIADLGASTGGFCQVLLENGVKKIYAVDIGTAQLHPLLKNDDRIINMEHTNARYLTSDSFLESVGAVTADLSFISIKAILPSIYQILTDGGEAVVLIKPQFEVGPSKLSKSGVVNDRKNQFKAVEEVVSFAISLGFGVCGLSFSGLAGESGNREYLLYIKKNSDSSIQLSDAIHSAVYLEG